MQQDIIEDFFRQNTYLDSATGAKASLTRKLTLPKWDLEARFHAKYPALLRERAHQCPPHAKSDGKLTKLQRDVLTAVWASEQQGFDEAAEFKTRLRDATDAYQLKLAVLRLQRDAVPIVPRKRGAHKMSEKFVPREHKITAPTQEAFFKVLRERKVKYTVVENATRCPIHDDGPSQELELEKVNERLRMLHEEVGRVGRYTNEQSIQKQKLLSAKRRLDKQVQTYRWHCRQYEVQRKKVQDIEKALCVGQGVLYRDFVNDHDERGVKICNLVWVLRQRVTPGGKLTTTNIHNMATKDSCDSFFTVDVADFHLSKGDAHHSGLFDCITDLTVVSDHGPHFTSNEVIYSESTYFAKYDKAIRTVFLCSYHAYNRCDGAGVIPKRLSKSRQRQGCGPVGASEYVHAVNLSNYTNHIAFYFPEINRGPDVFPDDLRKYSNLRSMCDFQYHYVGADGAIVREPGVVLVRYITDDAERQMVLDFVKRKPEEVMCDPCSQAKLRPVRHGLDQTVCPCVPVTLQNNDRGIIPDPKRIYGPRVSLKKGGKRLERVAPKPGKTVPVGNFPCMYELCPRHFKTAQGANRHMKSCHSSEALVPYVVKKAKKKRVVKGASVRASGRRYYIFNVIIISYFAIVTSLSPLRNINCVFVSLSFVYIYIYIYIYTYTCVCVCVNVLRTCPYRRPKLHNQAVCAKQSR
jgi:hypothetical protein